MVHLQDGPDAILDVCTTIFVMMMYDYYRRAQLKRARTQMSSAVQSYAWESGFTVEGRAPNKPRRRMLWQHRLHDLSDIEFLKRYKVRKHTFDKMVTKLRPLLEPNHVRSRASSGSEPVTTELQLSMTLRWLAGA